MVRMSLLGRVGGLAAVLALGAEIAPALAMPIAKLAPASFVADAAPEFARVAYDAPRRPYCKLESQRHFQD